MRALAIGSTTYFVGEINNDRKMLTNSPSGPNVTKLFTAVIYEFCNKQVFVRLGLKSLPRTNTLCYYANSYIPGVRSFTTLAPGPKVLKLFTSVIY
jgi:hypothetical protein